MSNSKKTLTFTNVADGTTENASVNASGGELIWGIQPTSPNGFLVHSIQIAIADTDSDYNLYGNIDVATAGTGIQIVKGYKKTGKDMQVLEDLFGMNFKKTTDFGRIPDTEIRNINSAANATRLTYITLKFPKPVQLTGRHFEGIFVLLNDDFTGLEEHYFSITPEIFPYL